MFFKFSVFIRPVLKINDMTESFWIEINICTFTMELLIATKSKSLISENNEYLYSIYFGVSFIVVTD